LYDPKIHDTNLSKLRTKFAQLMDHWQNYFQANQFSRSMCCEQHGKHKCGCPLT
jgi:hypothetical protein